MTWLRFTWIPGFLVLLLALNPWHSSTASRATLPTATPFQSPTTLAILLSNSPNADLYILDENSLSVQLIAQNLGATALAWSSDHKRIALRQTTPTGDIQIALMNADGSNRHPIYTFSHQQFSDVFEPRIHNIVWAPDNMWLAFDILLDYPQQFSYIYIVDTKGKLIKILGPSDLRMVVSRWLANPREISYILHNGTCNGIYVYNLDDSTVRFLIGCNSSAEQDIQPSATRTFCSANSGNLSDTSWSVNAQYLAVTLGTTSLCEQDIILIEPDTTHTFTLPYQATALAWSPDNKSIAYIEDTSNGALCVVRIDGSDRQCSSPIEADVWQMRWLSSNVIVFVTVYNDPQSDNYESQICLISVDIFGKHCSTSSLSGIASLID